MECAPVGVGGDPERAVEVAAQRGCGSHSGVAGDLFDAVVGGLEEFLGPVYPLVQQSLQGGGAGDGVEVSGEVAGTHVCLAG